MDYTVNSIQSYETYDWLKHKHYAKRIPPIEHAFGLFDTKNILCGVITFGTPVSSTLRNIMQGVYKLMELNRLCVNDGLPKNTLSQFVSKSLLLMPKPICIVSYADSSQGYHGYIYQATNWIYTGLSIPFKDYYIEGLEHMHHTTLHDLSRGKENRVEWLRKEFGDKLIMIERARKHRYFYFLGSKYDLKKMKNLMPYKILPYPKGQNKRYDSSYTPTIQTKLF